MISVLTVFLCFFFPCRSILAQQADEQESLFLQIAKRYPQEPPSGIRQELENLWNEVPPGSLRTAVQYLLADLYLKSGLYVKAEMMCRDLLRRENPPIYDLPARWILAQALYRQGRMADTYRILKTIRQNGRTPAEQRNADSMMTQLIRHAMDRNELAGLAHAAETDDGGNLWYELALRHESHGRIHKSRQYAAKALSFPLSSSLRRNILSLQDRIRFQREGPIHIGLIASLTGSDSDIGIPLMEGIELAIRQYNASREPKIQLHILDGHSDMITVIRKTRELIATDQMSLLIGPPDGYQMIAVATEARQTGIPVISPNVTLNRLTEVAENLYQANCDRQTRFEQLAMYATQTKKLKTFAALAPSDDYGDDALRSFIQTVKINGGKILTVERYYEGTQNFRDHLMRIRKIGMIASYRPELDYMTFTGWNNRMVDSVFSFYYPEMTNEKAMLDSALTTIDGLFLPVYAEEIASLPPQIAFYNIRSYWLGGDYWNDPSMLKQHQNYIRGLTFTIDYWTNPNEKKTENFIHQYRQQYKKTPTREAVLGYSLMSLVTELISQGAYDRDDLRERLNLGLEWNGLHNRIIFRKGSRVNSSVHLIEYQDNQFRKIN